MLEDYLQKRKWLSLKHYMVFPFSYKVMFPIYQSLYKHLPPFFTHQLQNPGGGGKIDLPTSGSGPTMVDSNHLFAAAAAAAMEQVAAAHSGNEGTDNLNLFLEQNFLIGHST